ncbi:MAG: CPBP family intramembrane metalloprotease [Pirellulales bacterium]|nr:CPBP family intramembrane metalloprotease [Pirellulales bacterium]
MDEDASMASGADPSGGSEVPLDVMPAGPRGWTLLAWLVIAAVTALEIGWSQRSRDEPEVPVVRAGLQHLQSRIGDVLAQYLVAAAQMPGVNREDFYRQLQSAQLPGPLGALRRAVLAGELLGPERAAQELAEVKLPDGRTSDELHTAYRVLTDLYAAYLADDWAATSVSAADRAVLCEVLGWSGQLAVTPEKGPDQAARQRLLHSAARMLGVVFGGLFLVTIVLIAGCAALFLLAVLWLAGKLRSRVVTGLPHGGVYAETFAVWVVTFLLASLAADLLVAEEHQFAALLVLFPATLGALAWPVCRGVPWRQVREDIGWTRGAGLLVEAPLGLVTYIAVWPLLAVAMFVTIALMSALSGAAGPDGSDVPGHPVVDWLVQSGWGARVQLMILACVMAPLVEETFYRGVLFRHLRELTGRWQVTMSVVAATLINAVMFAAVHPQGLLGIPLLSTLAVGFSLVRQWRGTLIPCMVAHAVTNGLTTSLVLLLI